MAGNGGLITLAASIIRLPSTVPRDEVVADVSRSCGGGGVAVGAADLAHAKEADGDTIDGESDAIVPGGEGGYRHLDLRRASTASSLPHDRPPPLSSVEF
ncbi:conserved hypothetical protein [Ricinus communis]|uniref:Uncharacterized protein n=1 Tax=Ricinus communis TaxID=3988 RepID=B9SD84_RICCO|nr:conserved hypothetical protein [Ricinus communis]